MAFFCGRRDADSLGHQKDEAENKKKMMSNSGESHSQTRIRVSPAWKSVVVFLFESYLDSSVATDFPY